MGKKKHKKHQEAQAPRLQRIWAEYVLEAIWLGVIVLLPMYINTHTKQIFELDKVALFRGAVEVMAFFWIIALLERRKLQRMPTLFSRAVLIYFITFTLATFFSRVPHTSFWGSYFRMQGWLTEAHYLVFFLILASELRRASQLKRIWFAIIAGSVPVVLYGLIQRAGLDWLNWRGMAFGNRIFSTFGQPNFLGGYIAIIFPCTLIGLLLIRQWWGKLLMMLLLLGQLFCAYATASRGALLGCIAAAGTFFLLYTWRFRSRIGRYVLGTFFLLLVVFGALLIIPTSVRQTAQRAIRLDSATYKTRLYFWEGALEGIKDRPVFGHGPESLYATFSQYYDARAANTEGTNIIPDRTHNAVLDVAYMTGLVGLAGYAVLLVSTVLIGLKAARSEERSLSLGAMAGLAGFSGFMVQNQFSFAITVYYVYFWLCLACFRAVLRFGQNKEPPVFDLAKSVWVRHKGWIYTGSAVLGGLLLVYVSMLPVRADRYFKQAADLENSGQQQAAAALYEKAVATYPEQSVYYLYLANSYKKAAEATAEVDKKQELLDKGYDALERLMDIEPPEPNYYMALARLHSVQARLSQDASWFDEADAAYAQAAALSPGKANLYDEWGTLLMQANRVEEAISKFEKALELFGNYNWLQYHQYRTHLGAAYYYLGEYETTLEIMKNIFKPGRYAFDSYEARVTLAQTYAALGRFTEALPQAEQAIVQKPEDISARLLLLYIQDALGKQQEAASVAREVLQLDPDNQTARAYLQL
ncbi:MAG TPA: O-antigen ligase family protein [bacterium]|nr:O-antigen ligase family protein [bacterium]